MVSLIIPFYNEKPRLEAFKGNLLEYMGKNRHLDSIILVNDGSNDGTADGLHFVQKALQEELPGMDIRLVSYEKNRGKGFALRSGIESCKGPWVLTTDADLAMPLELLDEWIDNDWADMRSQTVYIGDRYLGEKKGWVSYTPLRKIFGRIFSFMVRLLSGIRFRDTQNGFKLYPVGVAEEVFGELEDFGFAHDVEILLRLQHKGIPVKNLPVRVLRHGNSKVSVWSDGIKMLRSIWGVKRRVKRSYIKP